MKYEDKLRYPELTRPVRESEREDLTKYKLRYSELTKPISERERNERK